MSFVVVSQSKVTSRYLRHPLYVFFLALSVLWSIPAFCGTRVTIEVGGLLGQSCTHQYEKTFLTGSVGNIAVEVFPTGEDSQSDFTGFSSVPPVWLSLEFSYSSERESFTPSEELRKLLKPTFFLSKEQIAINGRHARGAPLSPNDKWSRFYYEYQIPDELAGETICVRAVLDVPPYGDILPDRGPMSKNIDCIYIVAPCSQSDRALAQTSYIVYTYKKGDFQKTVAMTDSLLTIGWISDLGLTLARTAANTIENYEKSLNYTDLMYENYGYTDAYSPHPQTQKSYDNTRSIYLNKIADKKQ